MHVTRILVIRFSSIGDIVLTTPVIRRLKEQLDGEVEIHFLTKKQFAPLIESHPYIEKVHTIEKATAEVMDDLKALDFNYVVDLHKNVRSAMVKRDLKVLSFTFEKYNVQKWMLVNLGINRMPDAHVVDRYLDTIKAFGIEDDKKGLELYLKPTDHLSLSSIDTSLESGFIALVIGGAHEGKRMVLSQLKHIIDHAAAPIVLVGGKEDAAVAKELLQHNSQKVFDTCGQLSIMQSASLVSQSQVVITGDTGMMHIASAFAKCIISVWGCTAPVLGMSAYRPHPSSLIIEPEGLKKRPCSKLGNRCKYGKGETRCISRIDPALIVGAANNAFESIQKEL